MEKVHIHGRMAPSMLENGTEIGKFLTLTPRIHGFGIYEWADGRKYEVNSHLNLKGTWD
jgi:hypothetical protein